MKTSNMRQYRIVPNDYLQSLFELETYQSKLFEKGSLNINYYTFESFRHQRFIVPQNPQQRTNLMSRA